MTGQLIYAYISKSYGVRLTQDTAHPCAGWEQKRREFPPQELPNSLISQGLILKCPEMGRIHDKETQCRIVSYQIRPSARISGTISAQRGSSIMRGVASMTKTRRSFVLLL